MTSQPRFIGVARPPQGVDPEPPRQVVNLSGSRAPTEPHEAPATPDPDLTGLTDPTVPSGQTTDTGAEASDGDADTGTEPAGSPVSAARPRGYGGLAEHRRRLRRAVVRRWEVTVWLAAALVVVAMTAFLVGWVPRTGRSVSAALAPTLAPTVDAPRADASATGQPPSSASGAPCIFPPCGVTYTGTPTAVRIPSLSVSSTLESLVVDTAGVLQPPKDFSKAGWWTQGVLPGDVGPAVIAGHVDSAKSGPAVFYNLHRLKAGDTVEVDRGGQTVVFVVTVVEQYPKNAFPTDRVYQPTPDAELRLITCGGTFDTATLSYRDNIVVYAVLRS